MYKNILERLCFLNGVNSIFLNFLDSDAFMTKLLFLNKQFRQNLPSQVESLCLWFDAFQVLGDTIFPRLEKLVFSLKNDFLSQNNGGTHSIQITSHQFPILRELCYDILSKDYDITVDKTIQLTKFHIKNKSAASSFHIPIDFLQDFSFTSRNEECLSNIFTQFLASNTTSPPIEKLEIITTNISLLKQLSKVLYKCAHTLRYIKISTSGFQLDFDQLLKFDNNTFTQMQLLEYHNGDDSMIYVIDPQYVTELSLYNEEMECMKCPKSSIFTNLKKLKLFGTDKQFATFLQSLGQPLSICAPNLESLDIFIIEWNNSISQSFQPLQPSIEFILNSYLFNCFFDPTAFASLKTLTMQLDHLPLMLNLYRLQSLKIFKYFSFEKVNSNGCISIGECRALKQLYLAQPPKCVLHNLMSLETFYYSSQIKKKEVDIQDMNSSTIRKLSLDIGDVKTSENIATFLQTHNVKHLEWLKLCISLPFEDTPVFLKSIFSTKYAKLKSLHLETSGHVRIEGLNELQHLELCCTSKNNKQDVCIANCPMLIDIILAIKDLTRNTRLAIFNLPLLKSLQIPDWCYDYPRFKPLIPLYVSNLPLCSHFGFFSNNIYLIVDTNCSEILQQKGNVVSNEQQNLYRNEEDQEYFWNFHSK